MLTAESIDRCGCRTDRGTLSLVYYDAGDLFQLLVLQLLISDFASLALRVALEEMQMRHLSERCVLERRYFGHYVTAPRFPKLVLE